MWGVKKSAQGVIEGPLSYLPCSGSVSSSSFVRDAAKKLQVNSHVELKHVGKERLTSFHSFPNQEWLSPGDVLPRPASIQ